MQFLLPSQLAASRLSCTLLLCLLFSGLSFSQVVITEISKHPHPNAHAHNDYEHESPIWDALRHGFMSIEADVWLIENKLYVKHNKPKDLSQTPEFRKLYFEPLMKIIERQGGKIYLRSNQPLLLMVDIKANGLEAYKVLSNILEPFKGIITGKDAPLNIFISGARPIEYALQDTNRCVGIDGRPEDLGKGYSADFMPVISQRFGKIIKWKGKTEISDADFKVLKDLADACHEEGKKLRLWASPETELAWETLLKAGVDLLNTDHLEKLDKYLRTRNPKD